MRYHLDLFSGIGGFSLAADRVWPDIKHIFVEYEPFCQEVLRKHWPQAEIHGDIREFIAHAKKYDDRGVAREVLGAHEQQEEERQEEWIAQSRRTGVYLLTGGFPCQPFSSAGRRKGTADDRYLWPEMFECVALFRPEWVIAENVGGLVTWNDGMVLETVCADLEKEGYEVQPFVIPACAVGAPHRRDRVWIVANRTSDGSRGSSPAPLKEGFAEESRNAGELAGRPEGSHSDDAYARNEGLEGNEQQQPARHGGQLGGNGSNERWDWSENWIEVATRLCTLDDGLSNGLVRPKGWRNAALKAAGNAIVPQVATEIMKAISIL